VSYFYSFQSIFIFSIFQNKNFIVLLSNLSPGAKLGKKSAAVVNITNGKLVEKDAQAACVPSWVINITIYLSQERGHGTFFIS